MVQKTHKHRLTRRVFPCLFYLSNKSTARHSTLDEKHAFASLAMFDIQYPIKEWLDTRAILYPCIKHILKQSMKIVTVTVHRKWNRLVIYWHALVIFWKNDHSDQTITKTHLFKYTENFTTKKWKFLDKDKNLIFFIFHISTQNIDCGYSLEPPRRGDSNEYHNVCFWTEIRKIMNTPVNPSFTI